MEIEPETRRTFAVIGGTAVVLLLVGLVVSGRPGDAIYDGPPIVAGPGEQAEAAPEAPADEDVAEAGPAEGGEVAADDASTADGETAAAEAPPAEGEEETAAAGEAPAAEEQAAAEGGAADEAAPAAEEQAGAEAEPAPEQAAADGEAAEEPEGEPAQEQAAGEGEATEEAEGEPVAEVALAGDPAAGERVFRQCQACHQVGDGAQNRVGPVLNGVVGRPVAAVEGFRYSDALQALGDEGTVWTPDELAAFLANPRGYAAGTSMSFAGLRAEDDIANVIAYLGQYE